MEHSPNGTGDTHVRSVDSPSEAAALSEDDQEVLRRRSEPQGLWSIGPSVAAAVCAFNRVLAGRKSEVLLMWPQRPNGIAILHALAALKSIGQCDRKRLATLFFPWNRNSGSSQRQVLVDRDFIYRVTLPLLNRIGLKDSLHPAYSYVFALHSLKHILTSGKKSTRLTEALKSDPGLEHPTLFEIMPQHGIQSEGLWKYDDQFLRRLQRYTWIAQRKGHMDAAIDPRLTPFFLFGIDTDAIHINLFRAAGLDPERGGRIPDVVLVDMTSRARDRLNHNWQQPLRQFLDIVLELYLDDCPPVLAVTDDVFSFEVLRHGIIKEHDKWRAPNVKSPVKAVKAGVILTPKSDLWDREIISADSPSEITAEVYGTDILRIVGNGLRLRRSLLDAGEIEIANVIAGATNVIQNLLGLPGQPQQFHEFLMTHYDGYERQSLGARFDHQAPHSKMTSMVRAGLAGSYHTQLSEFLVAFSELRTVADTDNPGRRRFDECIRNLARASTRSIVVFSSELRLAFADWRIESDPVLADVRSSVGEKLLLVDRKGLIEELDRGQQQSPIERIVFIEPHADDFLHILTRPWLPKRAIILANLARIEQVLRRIRILLSIDGIGRVKDRLLAVQAELDRALGGHTSDIGDLDTELPASRFGTLDLTNEGTPGIGAVRVIRVSDNLQIRAFDGSEFALYETESLQNFSRRLAKDLRPGDQICVFSAEFVSMARERLKFSANAPDILKLYHKAVADAAVQLPGSDIAAKTATLRERMLKINPTPDLPGVEAMRHWIGVANLIDAPRDAVRPQAPRDRRHYLCFMKALNISDDVARLYWDLGIIWTRSKRIQRGAFFHQTFMAILIDPYGAASRIAENSRSEIWRIYEAAQDHVATVISNEMEGGK